jgi:hypothetical protein
MATELAVARPAGLTDARTIEDLKYMQHQVHKLLDEVLQEGIDNDYAVIPGTKKKSLLKPGAEKICNLFRFVPTIRAEEYRDGEDVTFRLTVSLSAASGNLLGEGIGQASTKETKFAWRKAVCEEEYEATDPWKRRFKWYVDDRTGRADTILQVRENPADKENNMLKIAKKRALIDAVLTVTGCSNLFTQDREEDLPEGQGAAPKATSAKSASTPAKDQGPVIEKKEAGRFFYIWSKDRTPPRSAEEVKLYLKRVCGVGDSREMPAKFYKEACRWALSTEPVPDEKQVAAAAGPESEARTAFSVLGWDEKTQQRFVEQYSGDWAKILGELKILVMKREAV